MNKETFKVFDLDHMICKGVYSISQKEKVKARLEKQYDEVLEDCDGDICVNMFYDEE